MSDVHPGNTPTMKGSKPPLDPGQACSAPSRDPELQAAIGWRNSILGCGKLVRVLWAVLVRTEYAVHSFTFVAAPLVFFDKCSEEFPDGLSNFLFVADSK